LRKTIVRLAILGMLLVVSVGPAAASDREDRPDANGARATVVRVRMLDNLFRPRAAEVAKGTRVTWVNAGAVTHTATAKNGSWDSGNVDPGGSWSRVFRRAGTFRYVCLLHADMTGRIVVG